jgi:hypothetical protein
MIGNIVLFAQHIPALQRKVLENFRYVTLRERFSATEGSLEIAGEMLRFTQHDRTIVNTLEVKHAPLGNGN